MKIAIISSVNQKHMTLISHFTDILDSKNIEYDLVYIDKYDINENYISAKHIYKYILNLNKEKFFLKKVYRLISFRFFVKNILRKERYDLLIIWNSYTALLLYGLLKKYNKNKYIFNIRDYFFEKNFIIKMIMNSIIKNSLMTTISSKGFLEFLPKNKYIMVHSINQKILKNSNKFIEKNSNNKIRLNFIGNIRFFEQNIKLIDNLKNDSRFELNYYGTNGEKILEYVQNNNIVNVKYHGSFEPGKTNELLANSDLINNIYGSDNLAVKTALSIRLYHAASFNIPIVVSKNTYMEEIVNKYKIGFSLDLDSKNVADEIFNNYNKLSNNELKINCEKFINYVIKENILFKKNFYGIIGEDLDEELF